MCVKNPAFGAGCRHRFTSAYENRRRTAPAKPSRPVPNRVIVPGSGTVENPPPKPVPVPPPANGPKTCMVKAEVPLPPEEKAKLLVSKPVPESVKLNVFPRVAVIVVSMLTVYLPKPSKELLGLRSTVIEGAPGSTTLLTVEPAGRLKPNTFPAAKWKPGLSCTLTVSELQGQFVLPVTVTVPIGFTNPTLDSLI